MRSFFQLGRLCHSEVGLNIIDYSEWGTYATPGCHSVCVNLTLCAISDFNSLSGCA